MIVKYSKKFPYAPYLNEDIGFEMEVGVGVSRSSEEAIMEALKYLKAIAEKFHKDNNPQLTEETPWPSNVSNGALPPQPIPTIDRKALERLEILIDDAKSFEQLDELYEDCSKYGLLQQYRTKRDSLPLNK